MKKYISVFLALFIVLLFTGCQKETPQNSPDASVAPGGITASPGVSLGADTLKDAEEKIISYLETLCSREFAGRAPGTEGNLLAAEWLAGRLEAFGTAPYNENDYKVGYTGWANTIVRSEITVVQSGGAERRLTQGADFFIPLGVGNFSMSIIKDDGSYKILEDGEEASVKTSKSSDSKFIYFDCKGFFYNSSGSAENDDAEKKVVIQLSEEIYTLLKNGEFEGSEIVNEVNYEESELYNIAGRIRGTNSETCVVLTSHFDHVGEGGETYFPGALDNASGTATLLYIAERLQEISVSSPFEFDIVIAFFDSEEYGMPGSKSFVPILLEEYENIVNINIDCVGLSDGETYATGRSGSEKLDADVVNYASRYGIACDTEASEPGDNLSFMAYGVPSVYFITSDWRGVHSIVHTNLDTPEKLSAAQMVKLSDMLVGFISEIGGETYKAAYAPDDDNAAVFAEVAERAAAGGEVNFYDEFYSANPDFPQHYYGYSEYTNIDAGISALESFGDYKLRFVSTDDNSRLQTLYYALDENAEKKDTRIPGILLVLLLEEEFDGSGMRVEELPDFEGFSIVKLSQANKVIGLRYSKNINFFVSFGYDIDVFDVSSVGVKTIPELTESDIAGYIQDIRLEAFAGMLELYFTGNGE